jgi:phosphoribosylformylglycinamidine synthase
VVGLLDDASRVMTRTFKGSGDAVILLGEDRGELGGSEYLKTVHGLLRGDAPALDLAREAALIALVTRSAGDGLLRSAHDCSDGGLAVTLAECCFDSGGTGVSARVSGAVELFSESASRIVVSVEASKEEELLSRAAAAGVPARRIGTTGGSRLEIVVGGEKAIDVAVAEAEHVWATALERYFKKAVA